MTRHTYEIAHFRPEHLDGVLAVLAGLWPYGSETSARFFRWRYMENPYADAVLGIVALHRGRPVGFRGYFAGGFSACGGETDIDVLYPCDTVVAPEHRNQGLSLAMGKLASEFGQSGYRFFMNLTSGRNSRPGYLSLGFQPLAKRVLLQRHGRNPFLWAVNAWSKRADRASMPSVRERIRHGRFGDILVADAPRPAEMAAIVAAEPLDGAGLRLRQGSEFFAWRYLNPVRQYAHYFQMAGGAACAYAVLDISPDGRCGSILDYGQAREGGLREVLGHACRSGDFLALTALAYGVDARLGKVLDELGFTPVHTPRTLFKRGTVAELAPSILIRPVADSYGEAAFRVGALDLRRPEHWRLKPICSDGA
jgi:GNAT superfamily N-acetyltransferase